MARFHVIAGSSEAPLRPAIRRLGLADIRASLFEGIDDFLAHPSHIAFIALLYPAIGLCLAAYASGVGAFSLLYPLMAGFALLGPLAAILTYEISRRRERGAPFAGPETLGVIGSPALPSILVLAVLLLLVFMVWIAVAQLLFHQLMPDATSASLSLFLQQVLTSARGWSLIVVGNLVGLCFALFALGISAFSFPLMLDRDVGAGLAIETSLRACIANPLAMALWGVVAAGAIAIGFALFFIGLAVMLPIMGHATWHLYRRAIGPGEG